MTDSKSTDSKSTDSETPEPRTGGSAPADPGARGSADMRREDMSARRAVLTGQLDVNSTSTVQGVLPKPETEPDEVSDDSDEGSS